MLSAKRLVSATILLLVFPLTPVHATETVQPSNDLPEPLTLDAALKLIDLQHPDLRYVDADVQLAKSAMQQALSTNDLSINLNADARWIEPSTLAPDQSQEDHRLRLSINKTLYDFGRSASLEDIALQQVASRDAYYLGAKQQQYLKVMKRYFDVVLADLQFYRYNEEMAVAYIQYDRIQNRHKLGQHTDVEVAEKEAEYQKIRRLRTHSQNQQRVTRALLAQALNRPGNLPDTVARPELDVISRILPEVEILQKETRENNPLLAGLRAKLAAAKNNITYARSNDNPVLSAGVNAYEYAKETSASNKWEAGLTLKVPLWTGNRVDAAVAKAKAEVYKVEAELAQQEQMLEQKVLELWLNIETLKIKHEEMQVAMNFSELSLDRSRALYELEVTTDLGYSMVKFSAAERNLVQTNFEIALAWAQLDALTGKLFEHHGKSQ